MSTLNRRDYFVNLRKSFHINFRPACSSETLIFLNNPEEDGFASLLNKKALIEAELHRIDHLLLKLEDKLEQYKFGLPTLLIASEQSIYTATKSEIDQLSLKAKNGLDSFFSSAHQIPNATITIKSNIGAHLAHRLTEQYEKFQVFQKMFASILYERVRRENPVNGFKCEETVDSDDALQPEIQSMQVVLDEAQESMLKERSLEINTILADTLQLNDLLHQIQLMTVQQGSLLDRIDVNLDKTREDLRKTIGTLEKTVESFSAQQKRLILFFITLAIFVVSLLILSK